MNGGISNGTYQPTLASGADNLGDSFNVIKDPKEAPNDTLDSLIVTDKVGAKHHIIVGKGELLARSSDKAKNAGSGVGGDLSNTTKGNKKAEVDDNSSEDSLDLISDVDEHNRQRLSLPPLQERQRKGQKRVLQHQSYVRLVEDRLASLEIALARIEKHQKYQSDDGDDMSRPVSPTRSRRSSLGDEEVMSGFNLALGIARIPMADFRPPQPKTFDDRRSNDSSVHLTADPPHIPWHVIEVATAQSSEPSARRRMRNRHTSVFSAEEPDGRLDSTIDPDLMARVPERVRIRSTVLLKTLEKITEGKFTIPTPSRIYSRDRKEPAYKIDEFLTLPDYQPMVFLRPYKLFMEFEKKIRKYTEELQLQLGANDENREAVIPITVQGEGDSSSPAEDVTISKVALNELRLLISLFDFDLKGLFELRRQIKDSTLKMIAFTDLWHLFSHDEEVCCSADCSQVYRVLNFAGGRKYLSDLDEPRIVIRRDRTRVPRPTPAYPENEFRYEDDDDDMQYLAPSRKGNHFVVQCFSFDYDGVTYGPTQQTFAIHWYDGEVPINNLTVFPYRFHDVKCRGHSQASKPMPSKEELIERGKRFVSLSKVAHMQYKGQCIRTGDEVDSQVIIDFTLGLQQNRDWRKALSIRKPIEGDNRETKEESAWVDTKFNHHRDGPCTIPGCCDNDYIHKDHDLDLGHARDLISEQEDIMLSFKDPNILTDEDLMLFPITVIGFVLRDRNWAMLDINKVIEVQPLDAGLDALCLPKGHKDSLLALVRNHSRGTASSEHQPDEQTQFDLIPGKGKGLIVLLHGDPGVGKTSTAESIAAHTHRPLFPITCGDIGETADEVESRLKSTFQLAHKWGCVLLLDEADVFLQRRNKTDLQRNSIVSVFLRVLEYYSGILFLTSNRMGTIDPAFKSRIHMSLYYPALDEDATREIWRWHINNVIKNKKDMKVDKREIFRFALTHFAELERERAVWNGRQIRNAFQTAVALAEYDAYKVKEKYNVAETPHLKDSHFKQVARASKDFDKYLKAVWGGHSENDLARRAQERVVHSHEVPSGGEGMLRADGVRGARGPRIPRSPAPRMKRGDEFDDEEEWGEEEEEEKRGREDKEEDDDIDNDDNDEYWTPQRGLAKGKPAEGMKMEGVGKRANREERK
ncbi:MAG: hypothetical protein Q9187_001547 [Circinaria calcarea]